MDLEVTDVDAALAFYRELMAFDDGGRDGTAMAFLGAGDQFVAVAAEGEPHYWERSLAPHWAAAAGAARGRRALPRAPDGRRGRAAAVRRPRSRVVLYLRTPAGDDLLAAAERR